MAEAGIASEPRPPARLVLGLAVLALVAAPVKVLALTANDFPNSGYCSNGSRTTDLSSCKGKAKGKKSGAAPSARGKQRVR
jgi:hypothetical protein